ncbi:MFS general substrate transporter [Trichoderma chlorosporum]
MSYPDTHQQHEMSRVFSSTHHGHEGDSEDAIQNAQTLPPADHGRGAYLALACCTIAQAPIWGYSVSFGIFQEYYSDPKHGIDASAGAIATVGSMQMGIMYLLMPVIFVILNKYPYLRRWCGPAGLLLTMASLSASAFVSSIVGLVATQGALYSIGCALLFSPISLYMDEWFIQRKGLAYGIMWSGKSSVGVAMPFVFSKLLTRFGFRATILSWAAASAILISPTLFFLKPRIPLPSASRSRPLSFAFLRHASFWMMQFGIVIQSLGYLMPSTYLASYASAIGLSSVTGPILLALFSMASVPGSLVHGWLGDKLSATKVILLSSFGSAFPVFLLWGLGRQISTMVVFVIFYGFFAGGFSSTWSSMLQEIIRDDGAAETSLVFGLLLGGRGLGFILGGPISGSLLSIKGAITEEPLGYATKYGPMILCTGITAIMGAWAPLWKGVRIAGKGGLTTCSRLFTAD